jgi:hypothetical protein
MSNWTAGYAADVGYTYGYFNELNPLNLKLALLDAGIQPPQIQQACELGFGQGLSVNIHAAAGSSHWFGTDFSPSQAGFAQQLAQISDNQACLFDQSFAEFTQRDDLPNFDFIGLHGTWTWISDENRRLLVEFIERKLNVGGVLYISYNTQAGWANMMPIRHLLNEHARLLSAPAEPTDQRIQHALDFTKTLLDSQPAYLQANPHIKTLFERVSQQHPHYLAHEYFSADWQPMPFSQMNEWLAPAKLDYVCSANPLDNIDALNLTESQSQLLAQQPHAGFRETLRDLCVNQQFRKDYWVKGAQRLDPFEQIEQLMALRFILTQPREEITLDVQGTLGQRQLKGTTYTPILDFFADYQIKTLQQLINAMQPHQIGLDKILQAVLILCGKGVLHLAQTADTIEQAGEKTRRLNRHLLQKARANDEIQFLASPVTGGGILIQGYEMLFLLAQQFGHHTPETIARFSWGLLKQRGIQLYDQGQPLLDDNANLHKLSEQVTYFLSGPMQVYRALGLVDAN